MVCCVLFDHNSKCTYVVPINNKSSATVFNVFENQMLPFLRRLPTKILSDNGPDFWSQLCSQVLDKYVIGHISSMPYKPSSNWGVERVNRNIGKFLRSLSTTSDWDESLVKAELVDNSTKHR